METVKMNKKNTNIVTLVLVILTFIGIISVYESLPDIIPTHWNASGQIDRRGSKSTIWLMYGILIGINLLFILITHIDPKKKNFDEFQRTYGIFRIVFNIFFMAIIAIMITNAKAVQEFDVTKIILFLVGIFLAVIGNYLPKFKQNYSAGIKTSWTLASESVWRKTHKMAAPIWVLGGILIALLSLIIPSNIYIFVMLAIIAVMVLVPFVYSYLEFTKEEKEKM